MVGIRDVRVFPGVGTKPMRCRLGHAIDWGDDGTRPET